jgi:hypothetical protein
MLLERAMGSLPTSLDDEHRLRYSFEVKPEYFSTFEDARDKMQKIEGIMEMIAITVTKKPGHQHHGTTIEPANVDGTAMHGITRKCQTWRLEHVTCASSLLHRMKEATFLFLPSGQKCPV